MSARGWSLQDRASADAAATSAAVSLTALNEQRSACIARVREQPRYTPLAARLSDRATGRFNFAQTTASELPTASEVTIAREYFIEVSPCLDAYFSAAIPMLPAEQGRIMQSARSEHDLNAAQLIRRQISWGEYASRSNRISEEATARLQALR
jgi:hypothetical protein